MEYNTQRIKLIIPEYGRHIQDMVSYAKSIEDKKERQHFAEYVVKLMLQMSPSTKGGSEFEDKMWIHFFKIADYDIDVIPPNGTVPKKEDFSLTPNQIDYPERNRNYRHYGQLVQKMVESCIKMEEGFKKEEYKEIIGSFMKLAYKNWSREHYVNDEVIKEELKNLSNGELIIAEDVQLNKIRAANKSYSNSSNQKSRRKNSKNAKNYKSHSKKYKKR